MAKGIVERIADSLHRDAEAAGLFAIDRDVDAQTAVLRLRRHLAQLRIGAQPGDQPVRPGADVGGIGAGERILKERTRSPRRNLDVLHRLEIDDDAGDRSDLSPEPLHHVQDEARAFVAQLERDGEAASIGRRIHRRNADHGNDASDIRIGADFLDDVLLQPLHFGERDLGPCFRHRRDQA